MNQAASCTLSLTCCFLSVLMLVNLIVYVCKV